MKGAPQARLHLRRERPSPPSAHFHSLALDGVFVAAEGGTVAFHALPSLSNIEVAELLQTVIARVFLNMDAAGIAVTLLLG